LGPTPTPIFRKNNHKIVIKILYYIIIKYKFFN